MFKGLKLFQKTNSERTFNLASFHSPHSLTWSWILSASKREGAKLGFFPFRTNNGLQWVLTLPLVSFQWQRQQPMFYRDMYQRLRDEKDQLSGMLWLRDDHPHKIHSVPDVRH